MTDSDIDYLVEPSGECLKWKTHYCFSTPFGLCEQCVGHGHNYSQYKPVWKRMQNKAKAELRAGNYHYRVAWSEEDGEYVGLCAEFPSLSWLAKTQEAALAGIRDTVKQAVEDMQNKAKAGPRNDLP